MNVLHVWLGVLIGIWIGFWIGWICCVLVRRVVVRRLDDAVTQLDVAQKEFTDGERNRSRRP